ncbi:MAG: Mu-like prophage major head subunit gpT family protein, partial [Planctomycetaceae bacterium]
SLTKIFTTSVNAALLSTFQETVDTTRGWTRERDVADFKMNDRIRMAKGPNLARLPRGGTADHYDRSDVQESYRIARYARQFVVDEQDVIDNNLDAFADTPREMGLAAARLRPDLVYSILLANPDMADAVPLFDAAHGNLKAGAALSSATLIAAIAAIELQQENSVNLNLRASHLIVPSELKHTGAELLNSSQLLLAGNTDTVRGSRNTINAIESLDLVSDSRLSNGVTDPTDDTVRAGSSSTWFVAAATGHTIEVGFLRGSNRGPTSRSFTLDKGRYGMGWDVKMDVGAAALGHHSLEKNTA